jgi:hypothetical protein
MPPRHRSSPFVARDAAVARRRATARRERAGSEEDGADEARYRRCALWRLSARRAPCYARARATLSAEAQR